MFEIERKRHKGISLQLALLMQPPDLTFVCQQAPDAHRILIEHVSVVVGTDMHSLYQQFTILDIDPAVLQVDPSGTQLLTSVPFSSTPVSSASRTKYSWRASRFVAMVFVAGRSLVGAIPRASFLHCGLLYQYTIFLWFCKGCF